MTAAAKKVSTAFCLRWGDASLLFWWIRSHQDFGRNVNVMRQAVYFLVCSSESMLFVCLPSASQAAREGAPWVF